MVKFVDNYQILLICQGIQPLIILIFSHRTNTKQYILIKTKQLLSKTQKAKNDKSITYTLINS